MADLPDYRSSRTKAVQMYDAAFHLLKVTFPMVKDPKLLIGVVSNISTSMEHSMDTILAFERQLKLVPIYGNTFQNKFNLFRSKSVRRNNVPMPVILAMMEMREMLEAHKKSPIEFQRGNRFVICNQDYQMNFVSLGKIQEYLELNKQMLSVVENTLNRYQRN